MEKLEELNYHVDFGPYYVHLTRKQKSLGFAFTLVFGGKYCTKSQCTG